MKRFKYLWLLLTVAMLVPAIAEEVHAGSGQDARGRLEQIKQERSRLAQIRRQLEKQLGGLGQELRELDKKLVRARQGHRTAAAKVRQTDRKLAALEQRRRQLQEQVAMLRQRMLDEAAAAYQHSGRTAGWLAVLAGVAMQEIPHRRYMLNSVMTSQAMDRQAFEQAVTELAAVEAGLRQERQALEAFRRQKKQTEKEIAARYRQKQEMARRVERDMALKRQRDAQLAKQEKALQRLMGGLGEDLLVMDRAPGWKSIRKQKGRLAWPLRGKVVARFGSRPAAGQPMLSGVRLAPRGNVRQVKAIAGGQVRYADWFGGYGLMMIVDHGDGIISVYAHNDALYKELGDWVEEGEVLADAGSTGWISDVRLYFEVRDEGRPVNPEHWCRK
ncbi:MAG: peptidoglycan DD-metalloendopeptidase family protein [Mariprofundaceae bacterium]|nr:peptidoglycan DD-metalloendopeptidase family protein [Mariprofundaceae bacterium]